MAGHLLDGYPQLPLPEGAEQKAPFNAVPLGLHKVSTTLDSTHAQKRIGGYLRVSLIGPPADATVGALRVPRARPLLQFRRCSGKIIFSYNPGMMA
jgi:hypothetical protein